MLNYTRTIKLRCSNTSPLGAGYFIVILLIISISGKLTAGEIKNDNNRRHESGCETGYTIHEYYMFSNKLSVSKIILGGFLNLYKNPSASANILQRLPYDLLRGLTPTGIQCSIHVRDDNNIYKKVTWYEVRLDKKYTQNNESVTGWANAAHLAITTKEWTESYTEAYPALLNPIQIADLLAEQMNKKKEELTAGEKGSKTKVVGVKVTNNTAIISLYSCCYLDDSIKGSQYYFHLKSKYSQNNSSNSKIWKGVYQRHHTLCYRGASEELCK